MRRLSHYLKPAKATEFPKRILAFDVRPLITEENARSGIKLCEVASWHGCVMDWERDHYNVRETRWSTSKDGFWEWISSHMLTRKITWAIGFSIAFQLGLAGLWELLED